MSQSNDRGQRRHQPPAEHFQHDYPQERDRYADPRFTHQQTNHDRAHNPQQNPNPYSYTEHPHPGAYEPDDPNAYAPQFAPYAPSVDPQRAQHPRQNAQQASPHDQYPNHARPPRAHNAVDPRLQNPAAADWPNTAPPQSYFDPHAPEQPMAHDQHVADPHGYDAGGFASNQQPYAQHDPITGQPVAAGYDENAAIYGNDAYDSQPVYADDPNYQHDLTTGAPDNQYGSEYVDQDYADNYDGAEAAAGGTSRTMLIAGALVGAIVVGGGLAYGWKTLSGSGSTSAGNPPVVRSSANPNKSRPENPGGRQFDHADSKIMGRLGEARSGATAPDGTRKVVTVPVGRNGKLQPAGAPAGDATVSVPGLTVVDAFGAANRAAPAQGEPTVKIPTVVNAKTKPVTTPKATVNATSPKTVAPVIISNATKSSATQPTATASKSATAAPTIVAAKSPEKAVAAPSGSNGYVAVLASVPVSSTSRMNALMQYADMQQKYGAALANKTPDVREANLGAKGKYHRLLVGPPASRAQASALCTKLKSAGHSSCWVTAY